jgi:hypothetical protein
LPEELRDHRRRCLRQVDAQAYDFRAPGQLFDEAGVKRQRLG